MSSTDLLAEVNEILDNLELRSSNETHMESHSSLPPSPLPPTTEPVPPPPKPHLQLPQIVSARSTVSQPAIPRFVGDLPPAVPMEHSCWRITPASVTLDMSASSTVTVRVTNTHTHQLRAAIVPTPLPPCLSRSGAPSALVSPGISFTQTITYTPAATQTTPINTTLTFRCQSPSSPTPFVLVLPVRILSPAAAAVADDLTVTRRSRDARAAVHPGSGVRTVAPAMLPPLAQRISSVPASLSASTAPSHAVTALLTSATDAVAAPSPSSPTSVPSPVLPPSRARTPSSPALDAALLWPTDEVPAPPPLLPLVPPSTSPEPSPESSPVVLAAPTGRILAHSPSLEASNAFISSLTTQPVAQLSPALAQSPSSHSSHIAQTSSCSFELITAAPHPAHARSPAWSPAHAATPLSCSSSRASSRAASRTPSRTPARQSHPSASISTSAPTSASASSPHTNPFNERWQQRQHTAATVVSLARTVASAASLRTALHTLRAALPTLLPLMAPPETHAQASGSPSPSHTHVRGTSALPPSRSSSRAIAHTHAPSRASSSSSSRHARDSTTTTIASASALAAADTADIFARAVLPQTLHAPMPHLSPVATLAVTAHAPSSVSAAAVPARTPSRALAATSTVHLAAVATTPTAMVPLTPATSATPISAATNIVSHAPAEGPIATHASAPTPSADNPTGGSPAQLDAVSASPPLPRAPTPLAVRDPARFLTLPISPTAPPPAPAAATTCPLPPTPCLPLPACAPATDALSAFLAAELGCSLPAQPSLDCLPATVPRQEDIAALGPLADCFPSLTMGAHAPAHLLCGLPPAPVPAHTDYAALLAPQPTVTPFVPTVASACTPALPNASPLAPRSVAVLPSLTPALLTPHPYPLTPLDLVADTASLAPSPSVHTRPPPSSAAEQHRPLMQPLAVPDRHAVLFHSQYASATLPPPSFTARPPTALPSLAAQIAPLPPRMALEPSLFPVHVWRADAAPPQLSRVSAHHSGCITPVTARPTARPLFLSSITPEDDHTLAVTPAPSALPRVPIDAPLTGQLALVLGPTPTTLAPEPAPIPPASLTAPGAPYNPALAAAPGLASALALVPALRYSLGFGGAVSAIGVSGLLSTLQTGNVSNQF